ncbi:MAG TPA: hypothetical protein VE076_10435, partial [Nitrososphaeraceae archaeon]|nr:hypothetical protein [Nitrososphaeraceae archaeon]
MRRRTWIGVSKGGGRSLMITKLIIAVIILGIISTVSMVHATKGKSFNTERYTIGYNSIVYYRQYLVCLNSLCQLSLMHQ